jgi:hypothetical protein
MTALGGRQHLVTLLSFTFTDVKRPRSCPLTLALMAYYLPPYYLLPTTFLPTTFSLLPSPYYLLPTTFPQPSYSWPSHLWLSHATYEPPTYNPFTHDLLTYDQLTRYFPDPHTGTVNLGVQGSWPLTSTALIPFPKDSL